MTMTQDSDDADQGVPVGPLVRPILGCPFCGTLPEIKERKGGVGELPYLCSVACFCGTYTAHAYQYGRGDTALSARQDALDAWNRGAKRHA
jgi:hypothetical protein